MGLQIAVGMTTCPRSDVFYEQLSLSSLWEAGFARDVVSKDSNKSLGSYGNFKRLLATMLFYFDTTKDADAFLIFQDDVQVTPKLRPFLDAYLFENKRVWNENTGIVSLYTAAPHHQEQIGWHRMEPVSGDKFYGALAILMSRYVALKFDANPPMPGAMTMTDRWLGEFCKREGLDVWFHSPSFVRHIGEVSAISNAPPAWPEGMQQYRNCKVFCEDLEQLKI